jgi:hypothetical protein
LGIVSARFHPVAGIADLHDVGFADVAGADHVGLVDDGVPLPSSRPALHAAT